MSILDKFKKNKTGEEPLQYENDLQMNDYDDPFLDELDWDGDQQNWSMDGGYYEADLNGADQKENDTQQDFFDDPFLDDYDQNAGQQNWTSDRSYDSEYDEESQDEEEWYEPVPSARKKNPDGRFSKIRELGSSDNIMMLLCLIVAVILIFFCCVLGVKTHALSSSNATLEQRIQKDTKLKKSESDYESETEDLESETDSLINSYGAGNTPEKTILFLSNLSSTSGLSVTSIEFGEAENVTVDENGKQLKGAAEAPDPTKASSSDSSSDEDEDSSSDSSKKSSKDSKDKDDSSNQYYLYKYQVTFSYTGSYAQLKRAIQFIENYGERTTVNDITSTYDETTKNLTGSITLNMYTLSGTAQEYTTPSVSGSLGNSDIFG